uniref:G-protein coupled receptors family 1 profile domain-containing protein n=1 Tax=Romanomermis culicivorax TaxID=13658 RepID=A0A915IB30_ROMCU
MPAGNYSNYSSRSQSSTNVTDDVNYYLGYKVCEKFEPYTPFSTVLLAFVTPIIILFGLSANCLNFRIFTHKFMRSSLLNWYLAALAVSDVLILITAFFFLCLPRIGEYMHNFRVVSLALGTAPFNYPVGTVAQTASVWMTMLMSMHRFIGVCLPFKTNRICTKTNCKWALICVLIFAVLFNTTRFLEVSTYTCYQTELNITVVRAIMTDLRTSELYSTIYVAWLYFLVMFCIPFVTLITLNTMVIVAIQRTSKLHYQVALAASSSCNSRASVFRKRGDMSKEISTSIMLVGVVVIFLCCNTLAFVVNILELIDTFNDAKNKQFISSDFFHHTVDFSNVLVMLNASSNIFVYMWFSEKYRLLLKHYLSFGCFFNAGEALIDTNS